MVQMKKRIRILITVILLLGSGTLTGAYNELLPSQLAPPLDPGLISGSGTGDSEPGQDTPVKQGQLLYENHCIVCHDSGVHIRAKRRAKSRDDLRYWVRRWSAYLTLNWTETQIEHVVEYLNQQFYQFPGDPKSLSD